MHSRGALPLLPKPESYPLAEIEKQMILGTITQLNGDKRITAKLLGIGKTTLLSQTETVCCRVPLAICRSAELSTWGPRSLW